MELLPADKDRLVRALAVALPAWKQRADVAAAAGLSDVQLGGDARVGWATLVDEAQERGRLVALAQAAAAARPADRGLGRIAEALAAGRRPPAPPRALVAVASVVAVVGAAWLVLGSDPPAEGPAPVDAPVAVEAPAVEAPGVEAPGVDAPVAEAPGVEAPGVEAPVAEAPVVEAPAPVEAATRADPARAPVAPTPPAAAGAGGTAVGAGPGRCAGRSGWAHVGERTTLRAGDTWVVAGGANVRADRPREENGWAWRHPLVCTLLAGDRVVLAEDPVAVAGGAVWVWVDGGPAAR